MLGKLAAYLFGIGTNDELDLVSVHKRLVANIDKHTLFLLSFLFEVANGLIGRHIVIVRNMTFRKIR